MTLRDGGENRGSSGGLQTKGIEGVKNGVEGHQAREIGKMVDGVKSVRPGGSRQRRLDWRGLEEYQKKPMEWACARQ